MSHGHEPSLHDTRADAREVWLLLALVALCYLDKILLGPYAFVDFYDTMEVHFAHFQNMFRLWREFGLFSWYPFHAAGAPAFVGQHPPYNPAVFLSGLMPIWLLSLAWNMGQMILAGYGMLRLLRLLINPSRPVRLFCAVVFSLAWVSGNVHFVFSYAFPAVFAWTSDLARPDLPRRKRIVAALGILLVSLFSYPVLTLPHFPVLHLAFVLFLGQNLPHFRRQVAMVFAVWTGYVLLFAPSIVSLFLYIPFAQRDWAFHYPGLAAALKDLARFLHGRLTDQTMLPLLLLSLGLLRQRKVKAMLAMFAATLLISGLFSSDMKGLFANTLLAKMDLFLFVSASGALSCALAAVVLEHHRQSEHPLPWKFFGACAVALTLFGSSNVVLRNQFLLAACLGLLLLLRRRPGDSGRLLRLAPLLLAAGLASLGMFTRQQSMAAGVFVPYARGYEAHPNLARLGLESTRQPFRVAAVDVHPALLQAYGLDTLGGKNALFDKHYKRVVTEAIRPQFKNPALAANFAREWRQNYLSRNQGDHDERPLALKPDRPRSAADYNFGLLRLMGVTHLISTTPLAGMEAFAAAPAIHPGRTGGLLGLGVLRGLYSMPLYDYALSDAPGLGLLAGSAVLADSAEDVLRLLSQEPAEGVLQKVFLQRSDVPAELLPLLEHMPAAAAASPPRLEYWSPDRLVFSGQANGPALLLVANNFDPRWTATVNGAKAPLLRADHAFQAVLVDKPGPFRAELTFSSALIWQLHILSGLGVALMFSGVLANRRQDLLPLPEAPELPRNAAVLCPDWRLALTGLATAGIWALGFALFILRRYQPANPQYESLHYALYTIPLIGIAVALWTRALLRRL